MQKRIKILGYVCIAMGLIAAMLCAFPFGIFYAIFAGFLGMIISVIYIFIDTKNQINTSRITPGIIGLFLSSFPVLLLILLYIMTRISA